MAQSKQTTAPAKKHLTSSKKSQITAIERNTGRESFEISLR